MLFQLYICGKIEQLQTIIDYWWGCESFSVRGGWFILPSRRAWIFESWPEFAQKKKKKINEIHCKKYSKLLIELSFKLVPGHSERIHHGNANSVTQSTRKKLFIFMWIYFAIFTSRKYLLIFLPADCCQTCFALFERNLCKNVYINFGQCVTLSNTYRKQQIE